MDQNTLGRFKVIEANQMLAPGKCAGCGGFTKRHFVDFGLELDFYGVVYLCLEVCFTEVANQIGYLSPVQSNHLKLQVEVKEEEIQTLQGKLTALEAVRDAIDGYHSNSSVPDSAADSDDPGDVHQSSGNEGAKAEGSTDSGSDEGEQGSPEQTDEQGSINVHDDDSLEQFTKQLGI